MTEVVGTLCMSTYDWNCQIKTHATGCARLWLYTTCISAHDYTSAAGMYFMWQDEGQVARVLQDILLDMLLASLPALIWTPSGAFLTRYIHILC